MDGYIEIGDSSKSIIYLGISLVTSIIVYFIIPHFILPNLQRKTTKRLWIEFLRNNKYIKDCLNEFKKIEKPRTEKGEFGFIMLNLFIFSILLNIFGQFYDRLMVLALTLVSLSVISLIFQIKLSRNILSLKEYSENIKKFSRRIQYIRSFVYLPTLSSYLLFVLILLGKIEIPENNVYYVSGFSLAVAISSVTIFETFRSKRDLKEISRKLLNKKYSLDFPFVSVTTDLTSLEGKIIDIFDDRLIKIRETYQDISKLHAIPLESVKIFTIIDKSIGNQIKIKKSPKENLRTEMQANS